MKVLTLTLSPPGQQGQQGEAEGQVERLIALDPQAWQELFDVYFVKMRNFAYARTGDFHAAEDIAAEVFTSAVNGIGNFRVTGAPLSAWLYRIARNLTVDHLRRVGRRPAVSLDGIDVEQTSLTALIDENSDLARGLAKLPADQRELLALRFFNDCSVAETAAAMGKTPGAVKMLQQRALAALRKEMDGRKH